jgi:hypothetical protein
MVLRGRAVRVVVRCMRASTMTHAGLNGDPSARNATVPMLVLLGENVRRARSAAGDGQMNPGTCTGRPNKLSTLDGAAWARSE